MKIADIKYFDNFDMKEHTNIIDLKKVLYLHYDIEKNYFLAESTFTILQDNEPVLIENVYPEHEQVHHRMYKAGLSIFDIVTDMLNSTYRSNNPKLKRENISVQYFNTDMFFHTSNDWKE